MRSFLRDTSGTFGMLFALLLVPLVVSVGTVIDVSHVKWVKDDLSSAANIAVLSAVAIGSKGYELAVKQDAEGRVSEAETLVYSLFNANAKIDRDSSHTKIEPKVTKAKSLITSEIRYSTDVKLFFGAFLGMETLNVTGVAKAEVATQGPVDFYMLLDNTPSMGVGATSADIRRLQDNTPDKCAFACHQLDRTNNYYKLAKSLGVKMRIDLVREATQRLTETAKATRIGSDQYRMAVYSFGYRAENMGFTEVAPLSNDLDLVRTMTSKVDLMTIPHQNYKSDQLTAFDETLKAARKAIPKPVAPEKGQLAREQILFFVSDGVADAYKPLGCKKLPTGTRCQEPIDYQYCDQIKKDGTRIAVLYTTYLPLPSNNWYNTWIRPFQNEIGPAMKACASPGLFFEVSPSEGIEAAMNALFVKATMSPRLTF
ncbi:pilus assembly protein TadG-related protein [Fulvimarina sp. 2208YS6-2-32]|uniref:Pilus assembly protein TadG-related protein n=1 Tax=Fulvimarina uroteuthidis TaxID=3098149 RepID=A0ABU5I5Y8_9HYPH|nr:pilus assembly protein TadG-related protein [Fulvimarina sp. 2208YS6-2-32]MDY8110806.1 pilus assembly protein TadG-related protein [Fulvimarina sp. 2208YS6-2-32]